MEFDANVEHLRLAFWQIILTAGPILGTALAVGLTIGILQAATSINEMTLSFVPKLVLVLLALALFSPFIMGTMLIILNISLRQFGERISAWQC
jgi:flagellar biosynthetic protein FliQ